MRSHAGAWKRGARERGNETVSGPGPTIGPLSGQKQAAASIVDHNVLDHVVRKEVEFS
jgi:hypothetical protein